jgi:hypothetical protein
MAVKLQLRRDTTANWSASNPILAEGEIGIDTTLKQAKVGDGTTAWNSLAYGLATIETVGVTDGDKGDVVVASLGTVWTVDSNAVTNAKLADMATATIKGRTTAGTGDPEDLTPAQARSVLSVLEALTATRTYYVRTDGSDSNTGLANTSGAAFLTIQKAIDTVAGLLIGPYAVTINVADGTYTAGVSIGGAWLGTGTVSLVGNTTTPANCIISTTSASCISVNSGAKLTVGGFELRTTTSGDPIVVGSNASLTINNPMRIGTNAATNAAIVSSTGGSVTVSGDLTMTAAMPRWLLATDTGTITLSGTRTHTFSNTWAFSAQCVFATRVGIIQGNPTISVPGTITGQRYSSDANSLIQTYGSGGSYFPGSTAGATSNQGLYL